MVNKRSRSERKRSDDDEDDEDGVSSTNVDEEEEDAPQLVLTGFVHEEDNEMYLCDDRFVYSSVRDENGNLVKVGTWDKINKRAEITVKRRKVEEEGEDSEPEPVATTTTTTTSTKKSITYNFEVQPDVADHAETPLHALRDIVPALNALAKALNIHPPSKLKIYDPYYCTGKVRCCCCS